MPLVQFTHLALRMQVPATVTLGDGDGTVPVVVTLDRPALVAEVGAQITGGSPTPRAVSERHAFTLTLPLPVTVPGPHRVQVWARGAGGGVEYGEAVVQVAASPREPGRPSDAVLRLQVGPREVLAVGERGSGTVHLYSPAPAGGTAVFVAVESRGCLEVIHPVHVPQGHTGVAFELRALSPLFFGGAHQPIHLRAQVGAALPYDAILYGPRLAVYVTAPPRIAAIDVVPPVLRPGEGAMAFVTLDRPAPDQGTPIALHGAAPVATSPVDEVSAHLRAPDRVLVLPGARQVAVPLAALPGSPNQRAEGELRASLPGIDLEIDRLGRAAPVTVEAIRPYSLTLEPEQVPAGVQDVTLTLKLDDPAPPGGVAFPIDLWGPFADVSPGAMRRRHLRVSEGRRRLALTLRTRVVTEPATLVARWETEPRDPDPAELVAEAFVEAVQDGKAPAAGWVVTDEPPEIVAVVAPDEVPFDPAGTLVEVQVTATDDWDLREIQATLADGPTLARRVEGQTRATVQFAMRTTSVGVLPVVVTAVDQVYQRTTSSRLVTVVAGPGARDPGGPEEAQSREAGLTLRVRPPVLLAGAGTHATATLSTAREQSARKGFYLVTTAPLVAPEDVHIRAGRREVEFEVSTGFTITDTVTMLKAVEEDGARRQVRVDVTVKGSPIIAGLAILPSNQVRVGESVAAVVTLSAAARAGGLEIVLNVQWPEHLAISSRHVIVPEGATSASFGIEALSERRVDGAYQPDWVWPSVEEPSTIHEADFSEPVWVVPGARLARLAMEPDVVRIGQATLGHLEIDGPAPPGGLEFELVGDRAVSTDPDHVAWAYLLSPSRVTVPAGADEVYWLLMPIPDRENKTALGTVHASVVGLDRPGLNDFRADAEVLVTPMYAERLELSPSSVVGGDEPLTLRVVLPSTAPAEGVAIPVDLYGPFAGTPDDAWVPRRRFVFVPEGAREASVLLPTRAVTDVAEARATHVTREGPGEPTRTLEAVAEVLPGGAEDDWTWEDAPPVLAEVSFPKRVVLTGSEVTFTITVRALDDWDLSEIQLRWWDGSALQRSVRGRTDVTVAFEVTVDMVGQLPIEVSVTDSDGQETTDRWDITIHEGALTTRQQEDAEYRASAVSKTAHGLTVKVVPRVLAAGPGATARATIIASQATAGERVYDIGFVGLGLHAPYAIEIDPQELRNHFTIESPGSRDGEEGKLVITKPNGETVRVPLGVLPTPYLATFAIPFAGDVHIDDLVVGVLRLGSPAPAGGLTLWVVHFPDLGVAQVPETVRVPEGAMGVMFYIRILAAPQSVSTNVWFRAADEPPLGTSSGVLQASLQVRS